jgi:hypothetical protein
MSTSAALSTSSVPTDGRVRTRTSRLAVPAAVATTLVLAAEAGVSGGVSGGTSDHSVGAGRLSEALAGAAFVLAAFALAGYAVRMGPRRRWLGLPAVAGTGLAGIAMLTIAATGREWSEPVTTGIVLLALVGLVLQGFLGWRSGVWPAWVAVLLAALMPVMFLVPNPFNSAVMALCWAGTALATRRR